MSCRSQDSIKSILYLFTLRCLYITRKFGRCFYGPTSLKKNTRVSKVIDISEKRLFFGVKLSLFCLKTVEVTRTQFITVCSKICSISEDSDYSSMSQSSENLVEFDYSKEDMQIFTDVQTFRCTSILIILFIILILVWN